MRLIIQAGLRFLAVSILAGNGFLLGGEATKGPQAPTGLRCEYLVNPLGLDTPRPRLSWILEHGERGQGQSSYEILVSTEPKAEKGDLWASGKVDSSASTQVEYGGKTLRSDSTYYWRVRYWDKDGRQSPFSQVARLTQAYSLQMTGKANGSGGRTSSAWSLSWMKRPSEREPMSADWATPNFV